MLLVEEIDSKKIVGGGNSLKKNCQKKGKKFVGKEILLGKNSLKNCYKKKNYWKNIVAKRT